MVVLAVLVAMVVDVDVVSAPGVRVEGAVSAVSAAAAAVEVEVSACRTTRIE